MFYSHRSTGQAFSFFRRRVCNTDTGIDLPPCFIIQQSCFNLRHRYLHKVLRLGSSFQVQESVPCDWCHHLSSSGENTRQHWRLHGPYTVNTHYCVPTRHPNQVSTTASLRVTLHLSIIQKSCLALCGTLISSFFFSSVFLRFLSFASHLHSFFFRGVAWCIIGPRSFTPIVCLFCPFF